MRTILLAALLCVAALPATAFAQTEESVESAVRRAHLLSKEGRYQEALEIYHRALALEPANAATYVLTGELLAKLGRLEEAKATYDRAVALTGDKGPLAERAKIGWIQLERALTDRKDRLKQETVKLEAHLKVLEYELRAQGLKDDDVARLLADARKRYERDRNRLTEVDGKKLAELWRLNGLAEEEIKRRLDELNASRERAAAANRRYLELERELEAKAVAQAEALRRLANAREREAARTLGDWKELRSDELRAARDEFLRLGKLLGVSPEAAEELLKKAQAGRRPVDRFEWPKEAKGSKSQDFTEQIDRLATRLEALERRLVDTLERLSARMTELERRLK